MVTRRSVLAGLGATAAGSAWGEDVGFAVGQIWTLKPPMNPEARIRIGRIDDSGGTLHISLWGAAISSHHADGALASPLVAGHLPITRDALHASVDTRVDEPPPQQIDFEGGYAHWREYNGGVFTISVTEIVDVMLETIQRGQTSAK